MTLNKGGRWRGEVKRICDLANHEVGVWRQLVATRPELRSPFFSFEFAHAVSEAGAQAKVCLLYNDNALAGFFPFQFADRFAKSMASGERIGGTFNDFCGVMIDSSQRALIDVKTLLRCARLESFEASHLEKTQPNLGLRAGARSEGGRILLAGDLQHYWTAVKSRHPRYYETLRNRERKAQRDLATIKFVFAHAEPARLVKEIVAAKRLQYNRTGVNDGFAGAWKLPCINYIAEYGDGRCLPVVSALYVQDDWVALHLGLRAANVLHYWFPVYNPRYRAFSPGLLLLASIIQEAEAHGITEIDLGEGMSRYKRLFANEFYPTFSDFWYRASPLGLAYRGYLSMLWRTQSKTVGPPDADH